MRDPLRSTLLLLLLYVAGMGVLNGCQEAADRQRVQTQKVRVGSMLKEESFYIKNGKHVLHGTQRLWFENGQLRREAEYNDGKNHGRMTEWYESGIKREEGMYQNGRSEGLWQGWWEVTGAKSWEETYDSEGHIQRETSWWDMDGGMRVDGTFRKGRKHGTWTYWNENGTIRAQGEWRDGEPWEGVCGLRNRGTGSMAGALMFFEEYHEGRPTGQKKGMW